MQRNDAVWTISRADVTEDGPFSDFAGMMRVLTVVSGGAMTLDTAAGPLEAKLWQPLRFDGGVQVHARLTGGPLTDLNLMFDPRFCDGDALPHSGPLEYEAPRPAAGLLAFHALAGQPVIDDTPLGPGDTAFVDEGGAAVSLGPDDALLEIRVVYRDQSSAIRLCIAER